MDVWRSAPPTWTVLALSTSIAGVLGGGIGGVIAHNHASDAAPDTVTIGASATTPAAATTPGSGSIAAVAATILPSVVSIDVHNGASGDTGSGIVISDAGYILTNNHVVSAARSGGKLSSSFPTSSRCRRRSSAVTRSATLP